MQSDPSEAPPGQGPGKSRPWVQALVAGSKISVAPIPSREAGLSKKSSPPLASTRPAGNSVRVWPPLGCSISWVGIHSPVSGSKTSLPGWMEASVTVNDTPPLRPDPRRLRVPPRQTIPENSSMRPSTSTYQRGDHKSLREPDPPRVGRSPQCSPATQVHKPQGHKRDTPRGKDQPTIITGVAGAGSEW